MKLRTTASCSLSGPGCPFTGTNGGVSLRGGGIPESWKFLQRIEVLIRCYMDRYQSVDI